MPKKITYQKGERIGECVYLHDVSKRCSMRRAMFECECGNTFETEIANVKLGRTKSCGCYNKKRVSEATTAHGLIKHPLYRKWHSMNQRCYYRNYEQYKNYGGRGITVCDEWRNNFKAYYDYVMALDGAMELGLTIDRKDNDKGYYPGNLRWTSRYVQAANRGIHSNNTSGFTGVSWDKRRKKWLCVITVKGKLKHLGYFRKKVNAAITRKQFITDNNLPHTIQIIST